MDLSTYAPPASIARVRTYTYLRVPVVASSSRHRCLRGVPASCTVDSRPYPSIRHVTRERVRVCYCYRAPRKGRDATARPRIRDRASVLSARWRRGAGAAQGDLLVVVEGHPLPLPLAAVVRVRFDSLTDGAGATASSSSISFSFPTPSPQSVTCRARIKRDNISPAMQ